MKDTTDAYYKHANSVKLWQVLWSIRAEPSAANKYSSADHHEQKNKKSTDQIKFSAAVIKHPIKPVLRHSPCKWMFIGSNDAEVLSAIGAV